MNLIVDCGGERGEGEMVPELSELNLSGPGFVGKILVLGWRIE